MIEQLFWTYKLFLQKLITIWWQYVSVMENCQIVVLLEIIQSDKKLTYLKINSCALTLLTLCGYKYPALKHSCLISLIIN
jgi:hypothetical protein